VLVWIGFSIQASAFIALLQLSYSGLIILSCGTFLIFSSFLGAVGAWKLNRGQLSCFTVLALVTSILLLCFGGVMLYLRSLSTQYFGSQANCLKEFPVADSVPISAAAIFCTLYCPCTLNSTLAGVDFGAVYQGSAQNATSCDPCLSYNTLTATEKGKVKQWIEKVVGEKMENKCDLTTLQLNNRYFNGSKQKYIPFMAWAEGNFGCSGLCTEEKVFLFTDTNVGKPNGACFAPVYYWSQKNFLLFGIASEVLGSFQLVIVMLAATLVCCPRKKNVFAEPAAIESPRSELKIKDLNDTNTNPADFNRSDSRKITAIQLKLPVSPTSALSYTATEYYSRQSKRQAFKNKSII
jgi:hypothetical protein